MGGAHDGAVVDEGGDAGFALAHVDVGVGDLVGFEPLDYFDAELPRGEDGGLVFAALILRTAGAISSRRRRG